MPGVAISVCHRAAIVSRKRVLVLREDVAEAVNSAFVLDVEKGGYVGGCRCAQDHGRILVAWRGAGKLFVVDTAKRQELPPRIPAVRADRAPQADR